MTIKIISNNIRKIAFVPILDNLDLSIKTQLLGMGWQENFLENDYKTLFMIVDDPITRWYRQVCRQFAQSSHSNIGLNENNFIDFLLYNKVTCNSFTDCQKDYYYTVQNFSKNIVFFKLTSKLGYMLNHFLHDYEISNTFNNILKINDNEFENIDTLKDFLNTDINKPYYNKVTNYLQQDYDFINNIKFYAR
jgi:hypothetical protein